MKTNTVETIIESFRDGQEIFRKPSVELLIREIARLTAREEECHKLIDKVLDNCSVGMCTGDSTLEFRLAELVSHYASIQVRVKELEDANLRETHLIIENSKLAVALDEANEDASRLASQLEREQNPGYTCFELRQHYKRTGS